MEILILICLIIVIILLAKEKIIIKRVIEEKEKKVVVNPEISEIMGRTKPSQRHSVPISDTKRQLGKPIVEVDNFEVEIKAKGFLREIPEEELDEIFGYEPNLAEEEEEFINFGSPNGDDGFASGVTFDELGAVGAVLQLEIQEPALQQKAADVVRKIQGTELFSLLENSIEGASQKIADLLDKSLPTETDSSSSYLRDTDESNFDIREFV